MAQEERFHGYWSIGDTRGVPGVRPCPWRLLLMIRWWPITGCDHSLEKCSRQNPVNPVTMSEELFLNMYEYVSTEIKPVLVWLHKVNEWQKHFLFPYRSNPPLLEQIYYGPKNHGSDSLVHLCLGPAPHVFNSIIVPPESPDPPF